MSAYIDHATNTLVGGPEPVNYDDGQASFGQLCLKRLTEQGNFVTMIDALTGEQITSVQLRDRSICVARELLAIGIKAGDCVSISSLNRKEFAYVLFGTFLAGATLAPLNVTYSEGELHHAVNLSKPKLVFVDEPSHSKITSVAKRNPFIGSVIQFGPQFDAILARHANAKQPFRSVAQFIDDNVALILCSSGTTGLPKGVQLTQRNVMVGVAQHMVRPQELELKYAPEPKALGIIPWFHAFGCLSLIAIVIYRRQIVFMPKFEEVKFLISIQKYRINTLYLVPPIMVFLAKHPLVDRYDLSTLGVAWCGAAPLSAELEAAVTQRLRLPVIRQGYGMTEGTLALTGQTDECHTAGSVGVLRAGLLARVIDTETGRALPANQPGELWFKGSVVMKGYVGDKRSTDATVDADGWLHTGDIGYYEAGTGELFVVDRLKELIKYKGFQVPPAEIEGLLLQHADVMDAGVVGVPDDMAGELPLAFVVRRPGSSIGEEDIKRFVAGLTSPAKRLHGGVKFVEAIPKSPSGKILRRELRELLKQHIKSKL